MTDRKTPGLGLLGLMFLATLVGGLLMLTLTLH